MATSLKGSLQRLERLSPAMLHKTSRRFRATLAGAEWWMCLCLLAAVRTRSFRALGYATISEYAEKTLHLSGQKTGRLLSAARALEHLPLLSEAFRKGRLCWAKLRAINGLVSPETEAEWLEFALTHSTHEVVRKVALSPSAWKKHQALKASLAAQPMTTPEQVKSLLEGSSTEANAASSASGDGSVPGALQERAPGGASPFGCEPFTGDDSATVTHSKAVESLSRNLVKTRIESANCPPGDSVRPSASPSSGGSIPPIDMRVPLPTAPVRIRIALELTPDQFALFERAENRARARAQKRISRAEAVTAMARSFLDSGTARSRAKHQVVIHTDARSNTAWYETEKGPLPVHPKVLEQAKQERAPLLASGVIPSAEASAVARQAASTERAASVLQSVERSQRGDQKPRVARPTSPISPAGPTSAGGTDRRRTPIPNSVLRSLHTLSSHSCQRCGDRKGPFEAHHTQPLSDGGTHDLATLRVLCRSCHTLIHEPDFENRPHWAAARAAKLRKPAERSASTAPTKVRAVACPRKPEPP